MGEGKGVGGRGRGWGMGEEGVDGRWWGLGRGVGWVGMREGMVDGVVGEGVVDEGEGGWGRVLGKGGGE